MKNILAFIAVAWFLYVPNYNGTYKCVEIKKPTMITLSVSSVWMLETLDGKNIFVCGNYYIREE